MQASVDPVDEEICKGDKERKLHPIVQGKGRLSGGIIEASVAAHFAQEEGRCKDGHDGERTHCLADLQGDLVFEEFRVGECGFVEYKNIG